MSFKSNYEHAAINGLGEEIRGDEISRRIAKRGYSRSAQIAIILNSIIDIKNGTHDHDEELFQYETIRQQVKDEIDAEISTF